MVKRNMIKRDALTQRVIAGSLSLLAGLALSACGGEREEPFDPSEPEEVRDPVTSQLLTSGSFTDEFGSYPGTESGSRRLLVIDSVEDYEDVLLQYESEFGTEPDFTDGQVLLYDSGWVDDSGCEQVLLLNRLQAYHVTDDQTVGEVVLTYRRNRAREGNACDATAPYREYEFHYVETRAALLLVEEVPSVNGGAGSSSSASQSSSSRSSSSATD